MSFAMHSVWMAPMATASRNTSAVRLCAKTSRCSTQHIGGAVVMPGALLAVTEPSCEERRAQLAKPVEGGNRPRVLAVGC